MYMFVPAAGMAQVVDDQLPNVHPVMVVKLIAMETGIWPAYNISGQDAYDLFVGAGRDMGFVSLRKGKVFPVYDKADVKMVFGVKYPDTKYPILMSVLGGTFTMDDDSGKCFQIVEAGSGKPEIYSWTS
jgi:hypothetical protein